MNITFEQLPAAISSLFAKLDSIERLLQSSQEQIVNADQVFTIQEAAEFIKLSVPTLYGLVSKSHIPVFKKRKRLYFSKDELTAWVKEGRKQTVAETAIETDQFLKRKAN